MQIVKEHFASNPSLACPEAGCAFYANPIDCQAFLFKKLLAFPCLAEALKCLFSNFDSRPAAAPLVAVPSKCGAFYSSPLILQVLFDIFISTAQEMGKLLI
ncbi:hypothetical protein [Saliniradius amylolyticus]|uniref:hypothetical protein n=1 Tax=Saliniradius amylolyticus TaxID=2183582 RepID=UPI0013A5B6F7|nr:hypothetical protein [Saliniradius amylolyticus]